ncbi:MAG: HEAT repeat domain-containing protein [Bradymonadales bacterium]
MDNTTLQRLELAANAWSRSEQSSVPALFESLTLEQQYKAIFTLLRSPHRNVRDYALTRAIQNDWCEDEIWQRELAQAINSADYVNDELYAQQLLVLLSYESAQRIIPHREKLYLALATKHADLRYHALVALEQSLETGERYWDLLLDTLRGQDSDMRIVASQAFVRLANKDALPALEVAARYAFGEEAFHILIARIALGESSLEGELCKALYNDATSYAAILAIERYGSAASLEALASIWRSPFTEPTVRIAAARCAAKFGATDALDLLQSLAKKKSGNPDLAQDALKNL